MRVQRYLGLVQKREDEVGRRCGVRARREKRRGKSYNGENRRGRGLGRQTRKTRKEKMKWAATGPENGGELAFHSPDLFCSV